MDKKFARQNFAKRLKTILAVDFRRMFTMPLLYIMIGVCLVVPILTIVMTTMMDGSVSVNPQTGMETVVSGFTNTWQAIGSYSGEGSMMSMDLTSMCNINMLYFFAAVLVCLFVADDFRSGYVKNLFTVRAKKDDYVVSKMLVCFVGSVLMLMAFFLGAMLGGAVAGLPFDLGVSGMGGIIMCMLAKIMLVAVFVPISLLMSVIGKQKVWMSMVGSLFASMLLFTMIPMLTPLDSTILNVILCMAGGAMFSIGLGTVSVRMLNKANLV